MKNKKLLIIIISAIAVLALALAITLILLPKNKKATPFVQQKSVPEGYVGIYTKADLNSIRDNENMTKKFILMNDIKFTEDDYKEGADFYNNGEFWIPIGDCDALGNSLTGAFVGEFDGNGYTIEGLWCNAITTSANPFTGLFGANCGVIKNLKMKNVVMNAQSAKYGDYNAYAGGLCACNYTGGVIENCSVSGVVNANGMSKNSMSYAGGICAISQSATISKCETDVNINIICNNQSYLGGISSTNKLHSSKILNCSSKGKAFIVGGTPIAGGICAMNSGSVENCYSLFKITKDEVDGAKVTMLGGICGTNETENIKNCYYIDTNEKGVYKGIDTTKKLSDSDMKKKKSFKGFSFGDIWNIDDGYPFIIK